MSGAEIMGLLLDLGPDAPKLPAVPPKWRGEAETVPGRGEMLLKGLTGLPKYPLRAMRSLPAAIPNLDDTPFAALPGAGLVSRVARGTGRVVGREIPVKANRRFTVPKTSFNGRISAHRKFTFGNLDLEDVKQVKNHHGCTVNDVVVSICAGAVRRWLIEHDDLPATPLVAQVPVSVRTGEQVGTYGNRILLMSAPLFTDEADPVERLRQTHEAMGDMKRRHKALPAGLLQDANHFIPPAVFARAAQLTFRLSTSRVAAPTWNLVISNVPGPQIPLYCAGARMVANYPVSVITDGMGLNITVMSYCGSMDFGIIADREQMPDLQKLIGWLGEELEALKPRKTRRRGSANGAKAAASTPSRAG
jgi:WS/DGAT/MGAT family acyltransferase